MAESKRTYSREALLALKGGAAGKPHALAADCPVLAAVPLRTNAAVPVVRHARKAQPRPGAASLVSAEEREQLAEVRRQFQQRASAASPAAIGAAAQCANSSQLSAQTDAPATAPPARAAETTPPTAGAAWGGKKPTAAAAASDAAAAAAIAAPPARDAAADAGESSASTRHRGWKPLPAAPSDPSLIPAAPITRAARRAAEVRAVAAAAAAARPVREPEPLPGDPAAQVPHLVRAREWTYVSLSPEYYVVPVPVLVTADGTPIAAADLPPAAPAGAAAAPAPAAATRGADAERAPGGEGRAVAMGAGASAGGARLKARPKELSADEMARRVQQRERQIRLGQRTLGFKVWERLRRSGAPLPVDATPPPPVQACSKRSWDGQVRRWRQLLHEYDRLAGEVFTAAEIVDLQQRYQQAERAEAEAASEVVA